MTYTTLFLKPSRLECFSHFLTLTYGGRKNNVDCYIIDSVESDPTDKYPIDINFKYGQIYVDHLRNTVLISMEEIRDDYESQEAARSVTLEHIKGKCYRGDVIDTKLFYGFGSICDFHFIE